ncbi:MAG: hypothetical protein AAB297_08780, partial [Acidobacteriota bacterium]
MNDRVPAPRRRRVTSASVSRPVFLAAAFLGVLLLGAGEARAQAIAVDSTSSAAGLQVDTLTWAHTVGAGLNRALYVGVSIRNASAVTSVTYGGTPLTLVGSQWEATGKNNTEIWRMIAPPTGTANIVVTLPQSRRFIAGAVSFFNVNQTTPNDPFVGAEGTSTTPAITVASLLNDVVLDVATANGDSNSLVQDPGQTLRYANNTGNNGNEVRGGASTKPGAASVAMSWTLGALKPWSIGAISIHPVTFPVLNISKT